MSEGKVIHLDVMKSAGKESVLVTCMLYLNSGHLTDRTAAFLARTDVSAWPACGGRFFGYGFIFEATRGNGVGSDFIPRDLSEVFDYVLEKGHSQVRLDQLGAVVDNLPIYRSAVVATNVDPHCLPKLQSSAQGDTEMSLAAVEQLRNDVNFEPTAGYLGVKIAEAVIPLLEFLAGGHALAAAQYRHLERLADLAAAFYSIADSASDHALATMKTILVPTRDLLRATLQRNSRPEAAELRRVYNTCRQAHYWSDRAAGKLEVQVS